MHVFEQPLHLLAGECALCTGYCLRWRSDIWRTDRGVAEVRSPSIRPATDDDIRHNAPGLLATGDQLLRRKLLNQDKHSRLGSYALKLHKAKSARLAASEFSFLLAVLRRSKWVRASGAGVRRKLWNFSKWRKSLVESGLLGWRRWRGAWHCSKPDSGANRSREKWSRTCTCVNAAQHGLELDLRDSIFPSKTRKWRRSISVPQALSPTNTRQKCNGQRMISTTDLVYLSPYFIYSLFCLFTGCMCETSA